MLIDKLNVSLCEGLGEATMIGVTFWELKGLIMLN